MTLSARMPDLAAFEVLQAVAREGGLGAAGRALGLTQQAVSARVAALEARAGVRLVDRSPRGSRLTDAGRLTADWADRLLEVAHEVDTALAALRDGARTRLRVSASLTVAEQLLPGWLVSLRRSAEARGGVPVEVVLTATNSEHVVEQVVAGTADVGFVEGPRVPAGLRSTVVARDELILVVAPTHPWVRRRRPLTAAEVATTPLVTREEGSGTRESLDRALDAALGPDRPRTAPALELSTATAVRGAVLAGSAPAVVSRLAVADVLAGGRLRELPVEGRELHRALRAVWSGGRTPPAGAVRDLLSHIRSGPPR